MKSTYILVLAILLSSCITSCREKEVIHTNPKKADVSYSFDKEGDDLSKCMLVEREKLVVFAKTYNSFRIYITDLDHLYPLIYAFPKWGQNFNAEGMIEVDYHIYIVYGSMDGYPAWGKIDLSKKDEFNIQKIGDREGILYSGTRFKSGNFAFVGEILDGSDKQNFILETTPMASFVDSLSFGSSKNDGAVDIITSKDKNIMYLLSYTYNGQFGDRDIEVREYDEFLNLKRMISLGKAAYEQPERIVESMGDLFVCGHTTSFGDPMHDAYLARIDGDSLSVIYENAIKLDGHEGADDMKVTKDGNLAICSFAQMNPYKGGYYALIHPDGVALYQEKFMEYERFYQLEVFDDRVVLLGQKMNNDFDAVIHMKFF